MYVPTFIITARNGSLKTEKVCCSVLKILLVPTSHSCPDWGLPNHSRLFPNRTVDLGDTCVQSLCHVTVSSWQNCLVKTQVAPLQSFMKKEKIEYLVIRVTKRESFQPVLVHYSIILDSKRHLVLQGDRDQTCSGPICSRLKPSRQA